MTSDELRRERIKPLTALLIGTGVGLFVGMLPTLEVPPGDSAAMHMAQRSRNVEAMGDHGGQARLMGKLLPDGKNRRPALTDASPMHGDRDVQRVAGQIPKW